MSVTLYCAYSALLQITLHISQQNVYIALYTLTRQVTSIQFDCFISKTTRITEKNPRINIVKKQ